MAVDMVTSAEAKTQLEISGTARDNLIAALIPAASRAINNRCRRELTPKTASATRTFRVPIRGGARPTIVDFARYDLRTATTVTLHPESGTPQVLTANQDYALWPIGAVEPTLTYLGVELARSLSPALSSFAQEFGYAQLQVAGAWGAWDTADVPAEVKRACIVTIGAWMDKAVAAYGEDIDESGRSLLPSFFSSLTVPKGAYSILQDAGIVRGTTV